uniref:Uncharacterized protein n=1 Tax=Arundo donax TaxID=35708 RepID=A0A0A9DLS9_ARUDO
MFSTNCYIKKRKKEREGYDFEKPPQHQTETRVPIIGDILLAERCIERSRLLQARNKFPILYASLTTQSKLQSHYGIIT